MNASVQNVGAEGVLPPGWRRVRLEDCVNIYDHLRVPLNQQERAARPGPYPYYGANGQVDSVGDFIFDGEFVLIAEDGGYFDEPHRGVAYRATGKFWVNNHAHVVQSNGVIEHDLLIAQLNSLDWSPFVGGSTRAKLTQAALRGIPVLVPPLAEQRRLAGKLAQVAAKSRTAKDALSAVPALLNQLRQATLAAAFRGDLTADWRAKHPDVEPADKLLERIRAERRRRWEEAELATLTAKGKPPTDDRWKDRYKEPVELDTSSLPSLPHGWAWAGAEMCAREITVGHVGPMKDEYISTGVPFLRSQNIRENRFDPREIKYISTDFHAALSKSALSPGDVVIVRSGAPGTTCVIPPELTVANCSDVVIVRLLSLVDPYFISFYLNSSAAKNEILDRQVGMAQQHFNIGAMRTMLLPVPPLEEQRLIAERLNARFAATGRIIAALEIAARQTQSLEQAILAKAFRGELVPQDPNDEPAWVLLERLRAEAAAEPTRKAARRSRKADDEPAPAEPAPSATAASASESPTRRPRRAASDAAATASAEVPAAPTSARATTLGTDAPARTAEQAALAFPADATPFLDLPADAQAELVHAVLLGEGPLAREDAVRRAAELLRDQGRAQFQRLRSDGPLATALDHAISLAIRHGRIDRPERGTVRAVARTPADIPPALWRRAILTAQQTAPNADPDTLVRTAATWLQTQVGLDFQRLRTGGHIDTALRQALCDLG